MALKKYKLFVEELRLSAKPPVDSSGSIPQSFANRKFQESFREWRSKVDPERQKPLLESLKDYFTSVHNKDGGWVEEMVSSMKPTEFKSFKRNMANA